jgi:hypothetical protein
MTAELQILMLKMPKSLLKNFQGAPSVGSWPDHMLSGSQKHSTLKYSKL